MLISQDRIFSEYEGDSWFERNRDGLNHFKPDADLPIKLIQLYQLQPKNVLEVGAANGFRLAKIAEKYHARTVALEPSIKAIQEGKKLFPRVHFVKGEAGDIPLQDAFDLIIVNFVLHWIDRRNLFRSVAEMDRLLADGGYLIIGDFLPTNLTKVRYHHLQDQNVFTFKQNYASTFISSGLYHSVCLMTAEHGAKTLKGDVCEYERIGVWLLKKQLEAHYSG